MKRLKILILGLSLIGSLALAGSAGAYTISYTDPNQVPGDLITYTLDFTLNSGTTYNAAFSIHNSASASPSWYAGWLAFKFDGSASPISNLTAPSGTGPWSIMNTGGSVSLLTGGGNYSPMPPNGGFTGFYVTSLSLGNGPANDTQGILVDGTPSTSTFTFQFTTPGSTVNTTSMPFQVGYYDALNGNGGIIVNRLSQNLTSNVPEPGSIILLGTGLTGVWILARGRKKG